jgi:hypothetical protein
MRFILSISAFVYYNTAYGADDPYEYNCFTLTRDFSLPADGVNNYTMHAGQKLCGLNAKDAQDLIRQDQCQNYSMSPYMMFSNTYSGYRTFLCGPALYNKLHAAYNGKSAPAAAKPQSPTGSTAGMVDARSGQVGGPATNKKPAPKPVNECFDRITTSNSTFPHQVINKCNFPITAEFCVVNGGSTCDCKNPAKPEGICQSDLKPGQRETDVSGNGKIYWTACRSDVKDGWVKARLVNGKSRCDLH